MAHRTPVQNGQMTDQLNIFAGRHPRPAPRTGRLLPGAAR
ncbi:MAG: hypothetical protein AVDCRST_MAG83-847 [uncultured Arthrobacter sp.]|uniref:Uncharacterized protein n=1 Tax=uncultured Arthrobacter sp. TaxID=114050 RepID=A0A6J4HIJ6_9MICC|nr:MAG: hypothetical protein AVDCRST_MAG83-847 [uncultured Arthrobacter sp.]